MANDPPPAQPAGPPPQTTAPPAEPGPGASRDEWRAWRHRQRDFWHTQGRPGGWYGPGNWYGQWNWWGGGWFWGAALLVFGVYLLLQNLGLMTWLRGDVFWPVVLILLGIYLIARRGRWWRP
ncbi:MAG: hypothetical protein E6I61_12415 [Chloroflexi bacterium]|nr:MAG: hypothetical protein E6I61_12415 [Chloroflexota bacterium]